VATLKTELGDALIGEDTFRSIQALVQRPRDPKEHQAARAALGGRFRQFIAETQRFEAFLLMDRRGRVVLSTESGEEGRVYADRAFFQRGLKGPFVSPSSPDHRMTMTAARPVIDKRGRDSGVLAGHARLTLLNKTMLNPIGLGKTGKTYLVSGEHTLLTILPGNTQGMRVNSKGIETVLETGAKSSGPYEDFRGVRVNGVYRWLPEPGVVLAAEQDQAESSGTARVMLAVNASVALAALLIAAIASLVVTRSIATPLSELAETAGRIAAGNLDLVVEVKRKDEIGALAQTFNSMTEKLRQTMDGLRTSEVKFRGIFENAVEGIFQTSLDGRFLSANPTMARILGYDSPEEAVENLTDIEQQLYARAEDRDEIISLLLVQGEVHGYECQFFRKGKQKIWVSISARVVRGEGGRPLLLEGLITDISKRKRVEELLAQKTAELERSNKELEQFASVASHDLKAPLATIGGFAQIVEDRYKDRLDDRGRRALAHIINGTLRMELLIGDILAYSRVTTGGQSLGPVACNRIMDTVLTNLRTAIEEQKAEITYDKLPVVRGDEMHFVQLFQNLIGNAIKYRSEAPPRVHISAKPVSAIADFGFLTSDLESGEATLHTALRAPQSAIEKGWLFSVEDNGIGIEPGHFDEIFEIFRRLHTDDKYPGTGIGLAICKKIVERHGGRIWVQSAPGKGSTFYFTVPDRPA
jgi:PAS domain S-box-containing protein